jgi:hypothetical protein
MRREDAAGRIHTSSALGREAKTKRIETMLAFGLIPSRRPGWSPGINNIPPIEVAATLSTAGVMAVEEKFVQASADL